MSLDRLINILVTVTLIEMMALIGLRMMLRRILILLGETPSSLSATHYALRLARNAEAKTAGLPALPIPPIGRCPLMEWSGRAPAPPAKEAGVGHRRQGARHV